MEEQLGCEHHDVLETSKSSSAIDTALTSEELELEKRLVRKLDLYILPCMWFMYLLSNMDRTNIGNAKIAGMDKDLGLDSNKYSIALTVFFVSYVVFEVPSNMILARTRPSRYLATIMFLWGGLTIGMAFTPNYGAFVAFRFLMGLLESGFAPGILMILSSWYRNEEQSRRFAVNTSQRKLSATERSLAIPRFEADARSHSTEEQRHLTHLQALKLSLTSWQTWLLVVGYMAIVGSSTLSYFYLTLVKGLGYRQREAQYMTIPIFDIAFVTTAVIGYVADKNSRWRGVILGGMVSVAMLCSIIICAVYNVKARYALLVIMASGLWASNGLVLSYASVTFSSMPNEAKAVSLALVNAMGNLAHIYGAYLFPSEDAPKYLAGFGVISGLCLTGVVAYLALHLLLGRLTKRSASN
ncbi:hypothetical protein NHJ13734_003441 [Beauveria thailandica]